MKIHDIDVYCLAPVEEFETDDLYFGTWERMGSFGDYTYWKQRNIFYSQQRTGEGIVFRIHMQEMPFWELTIAVYQWAAPIRYGAENLRECHTILIC